MNQQLPQEPLLESNSNNMARRRFLTIAGVSALAVAFSQTSCKKDEIDTANLTGVNFGKDDTGLLNYLYAIEQVNTYFYQLLTSNLFAGVTPHEQKYLENIRYHQETYQAFYRNALGSTAVAALDISFDSDIFSSRTKAISQAIGFADWSVGAYNGVARLFENAGNILTTSKIASVHARHSAELREWMTSGSYAGSSVVDMNGLDISKTPMQVLGFYDKYIVTPIESNNLPTY